MPSTILEIFQATARAQADRPAMARKRAGAWDRITWRAYGDAVRQAARALVATGVEPGQGVVILSFNRPEWYVANLATIAAGARPAGIYTNSTPEQCRYITEHAEAAVAVVENRESLERLQGAGGRPAGLVAIVLMDGEAREPGVVTWTEFLARGAASHDAEVDRRTAAAQPDDVATLIYTSGTTGTPKGVMLTQRNLAFIAEKARELLPVRAGDRLISYLPLSHIAEQVVSHLLSIATGACVHFAESLEKLPENLREVRPHIFLGVPRVWEKIQAGMQAAGAQASPLRRRIAAWARGVGLAGGYADQEGRPRPWNYGLADRLVFSKVRGRLGFDDIRMLVVSAAPIAKETLDFFQSLGPAHHGGLRHERVHRADHDVAPEALPPGAGRVRDPRHRAQDRRGRRDPDARAARLQGLLQERGGHARDARRTTAGSTPATWARSTRTASSASPTARRSCSSPRAGRTSPRSTSRESSSRSPRSPRRSPSATAASTWWPS